jgi:cell division protease FtsH
MKQSTIIMGILGALLLAAILNLFSAAKPIKVSSNFSYSSFLDALENDRVASVTLSGTTISGKLKSGEAFVTRVPSVELVVPAILSKKVNLAVIAPEEDVPSLLAIIVSWFPFLLYIFALWLFVARPLRRIEQQLQSLERRVSMPGKST